MDAPTDEERPLTESGRAGVLQVAKTWLASMARTPAVIAASPLVRAVQTADILATEMGDQAPREIWPEARPEGELAALNARLEVGPDPLLLVTHQPLISRAVEYLTGERPLIVPGTLLVIHTETIAPDWGTLECVISA